MTTPDWPDTHLLRAVHRAPPDRRAVVLLMTGALNPVHRGHMAMMAQARRFLEGRGDVVLAGWLSPSHDGYVQAKYARRGEPAYTSRQRLAMCRAACSDSDWLSCAAWEARRLEHWPDFPEVVQALFDHVSTFRHVSTLAPIHVAYVCGADHLRHIRRGFSDPRQWVIGVPRDDTPIVGGLGPRVWVTSPDPVTASISATQIRRALRGREPLDHLLHPAVRALLCAAPITRDPAVRGVPEP